MSVGSGRVIRAGSPFPTMLRRCATLHAPLALGAVRDGAAAAMQRMTGGFGGRALETVKFDTNLIDVPSKFGSATEPPGLGLASTYPDDTTGYTRLCFPFEVAPDACNIYGTMHGGMTATLADVFTSLHLWGTHPFDHVSIDLKVEYLRAVKRGARVVCVSHLDKVGGTVCFTGFNFVDANTGACYAKGTHIKAVVKKK